MHVHNNDHTNNLYFADALAFLSVSSPVAPEGSAVMVCINPIASNGLPIMARIVASVGNYYFAHALLMSQYWNGTIPLTLASPVYW